MRNNENLVPVEGAENVEQTTEQTPKTYTQDEVNEIVRKRLARQEARIKKNTEREYGGLVETLKAGTGKETVEELNDAFRQFYESKGIKVEKQPAYSARDIETLAMADAEEIIRSGDADVIEEVDRLAELGIDNMTARDKAVFKLLAERREAIERGQELSKMGVTEDVYNGKEFKEFASKFNANTPIKDIYDIYTKTQPKKEIKTMGSMKNNAPDDSVVKDFYSYEEAVKFTKKDFDDNPALMKAVENSMTKWK